MDDMGLSLFVFVSIKAIDRRVPSSFMAAASRLPYRRLSRPTGGITQAVWAGCPAFVTVVAAAAGMDAEVDVESHEDVIVVVVVVVVVLVDIAVVVLVLLLLLVNSLPSFSPLIFPFPSKSASFSASSSFFLSSSCCPC